MSCPVKFLGDCLYCKRFALCYRTVFLSVCPVCNVGVLRPNGWMDQDETWHRGIGLSPGHIVLDWDRAPQRGTAAPPLLSAHVYCGQTVAHLSCC